MLLTIRVTKATRVEARVAIATRVRVSVAIATEIRVRNLGLGLGG